MTTFHCSICEQESLRICVACTKDTCSNHLCDKCGACSDCCDCELRLETAEPPRASTLSHGPRDPEPHPHPMPDPDPAPEPGPGETPDMIHAL
jgi:hypothetical protein